MSDDVAAWAAQFATAAAMVDVARFGSGHVNDTYLVTDEAGNRYVMQSVNRLAFRRPDHVMENILRVTAAMAAQVPDPRRRLTLVPTRSGNWWLDGQDGQCLRMYDFIDGSCELTTPVSLDEFAAVGRAFGDFLVQMAAIPPDQLHVTIEGFHDEPRYISRLKAAVAADPLGRVSEMTKDIELALSYEAISHDFDATTMPLRVTHNDAKVSNVLFDAVTRQPLCVVDLDTVQPGYCVNDFGDAIRSGASTAPEDEADLSRVSFSLDLFAAFTEGYLAACGDVLEPVEIANLRQGARAMTLETSLRFLTDYIEGDVYYRIAYPHHNRDRARNQMTLLQDIDRHWDAMGRLISGSINRF